MRLAKEHGVTVLLDGQGGDETLAGYHEYFRSYYKQLIQTLNWGKFVFSSYRYAREQRPSNLFAMYSFLLPPQFGRLIKRSVRPRAIRGEFKRQWGAPPTLRPPKFKGALQEELYQTLTFTVLPTLLRYADRNSMAFSREVRLPFLDHRLVEFLFAIPDDLKIRGATTKVILRKAIRGLVPEEIRTRTDKVGFAPPEVSWMRGPLRPWIEDLLQSTDFKNRDWFEPREVEPIWREFLAGRDGHRTSIWRWISLEVWARVFLSSREDQFKLGPFSQTPAMITSSS
jgi:asparagine synthase (glutamine-hydrolysing)